MRSSTVIFFLLIAAGLFYLFHSGYLTIEDIPFIKNTIFEKPIVVDDNLGNFLKENNYEIIDFSDSSPMLLKFSSDSLLDMDAQVYSVAK
ncbi:MAG: hypothetical protein J7L96_08750 [Bacteroidales bacterium]|nr:hypothetical protein [Bacteroidales bacterium]